MFKGLLMLVVGFVFVGVLVWWLGKSVCRTDQGYNVCINLGYHIDYKNWGDSSGRTVIFSGKNNSFLNGFGYISPRIEDTPWAVVGYFDYFEPIANSPDEYVYLKDNSGKTVLKGRVVFRKEEISSVKATDFMLENLLNKDKLPYDSIYSVLAVNGVSRKKVNRLFRNGDVVVAVISIPDQSKIRSNPGSEIGIVRLVIRRFYGLGILLNE